MTTATWAHPMIDPGAADSNWLAQLGKMGGAFGALLAIVGTSLLALRKYLSNESVTNAVNGAQTDLINMLRQQIKDEHDRAEKAEAARDLAISQISELKAKVDALTAEVQLLRQQQKA